MKNWRELLLGYTYFYHKKLIKKSKTWSAEEVNNYNAKKLQNYKDFRITEKDDYITSSSQFENKTFNFFTKKVTTGGTMGTPFIFRIDLLFRRQKERAYIFDIWNDVGFNPYDLRVIYRGNTSSKLISYNFLENAYIIDPTKLTDEKKEIVIDFLLNLKPFYLHVYPSSLLSLIEFLGEEIFSKLRIAGILAGSEAFPENQMSFIKNKFNLPIAHWYGHSEYAVLAKFCLIKSLFCFYPTYGAVEFMKKEGTVFFKIIATSFNDLGTKFIRYNTKDLCTLPNEESCLDNNFINVKSILGREQEFFYDSEGHLTAFGPFLFGLHNEFWSYFEKIQFRQVEKGKLKVLIVGEKNQKVREILVERFFNKATLEFKNVLEIEKTVSQKHRYFIQKIEHE